MSWENVKLQIDENVIELMNERGIVEDDVKQVITLCEESNEKLYCDEENRFLGKKRLGEFTVYVEYTISEDVYLVHATYGHRVQIISES